jgi:hypothetical protein
MSLEFETVNGMSTFFAYGRVSDEAIQQCIDVYNTLTPHHGKTGTGVDKAKKDSMDVSIPPNHTLMIQKELENFGAQYFKYFSLGMFTPSWITSEHIQIQKYPLSGAFHAIHTERGYNPKDKLRECVYMVYLNDVPVGGETFWPFYNKKLKPVKGLALLWPPFWTHAHKGLPSNTTEKMIVTGWFSANRSELDPDY